MSIKVILGPDRGYVMVNPDTLIEQQGVYHLPDSNINIDKISYTILQRPNRVFFAVEIDKDKDLYALTPLSTEEHSTFEQSKTLPSKSYEQSKKIGEGTYGVFTAYPTQEIGIKNMKNKGDVVGIPDDLLKEISIYRLLGDFVCIPYLYGFQISSNISMELELGVSTLYHQLKKLTMEQKKRIAYRLFRCMYVISRQGIIHCDLKPQNTIITRNGSIQIIDWGLAEIDRTEDWHIQKSTQIQTLLYRAPEIVLANLNNVDLLRYNDLIDIFSLGCILFDLHFTTKPLFTVYDEVEYAKRASFIVKKGESVEEFKKIMASSTSVASMLKNRCVNYYKIPEDPADLISKMLEYSPDNRIKYQEILNHPYFEDMKEDVEMFPTLICNSLIPVGVDVNSMWHVAGAKRNLRALLFDWLGVVAQTHNFSSRVKINAYQLADFYIYKTKKKWDKKLYLCICITAFYISSKLLSNPIDVADSVHITNDKVTAKQITDMEKDIVTVLQGNLLVPSLYSFYEHDHPLTTEIANKITQLYLQSNVYDLLNDASRGGKEYLKEMEKIVAKEPEKKIDVYEPASFKYADGKLTITRQIKPSEFQGWISKNQQEWNSLRELHVLGKRLESLPDLPDSLKSLYCTDNLLVSLPDLPDGLEQLVCGSNQLTSLPRRMPKAMLSLNCSYNKIKYLPPLPAEMKYLECSHNELKSLPPLPNNLRIVVCISNQLKSLPSLPEHFEYLDCIDNQITSLPPLPAEMKSLDCSHNELKSLPDLPDGLEYLECTDNQITALPDPLPTKLTLLNCSRNQLKSLPDPLPANLTELECAGNPNLILPDDVKKKYRLR